MTAKELMEMMQKDPEYQARKKAKEEEMERLHKRLDEDEKELLAELRKAGFDIESVCEFSVSNFYYADAIPTLKKHLATKHHPKIRECILRALALPDLYDDQELWDTLVEMYYNTLSDSEIDIPEMRGNKQVISLALCNLATEERIETLKELIESNKENIDEVGFFEDALLALAEGKHPTQKMQRHGKPKRPIKKKLNKKYAMIREWKKIVK